MNILKTIAKLIVAAVVLLAVTLAGVLAFGPVSNPKAMLSVLFGYSIQSPAREVVQTRLQVPDGFSIGHYARNLGNIRFMAFSSGGDLLVSKPRQGQVILLRKDANNDGQHDGESVLLNNLQRPHGLAFHNNWLYIAESDSIGRVAFDHKSGKLSGEYEKIITGLTDDGNHWSKSILINNDKLYVSMGSTCNVCEEQDERRATIMEFSLDGSNGLIYATGLRNSVGLDTAPWSGEIFATDNGRDLLGDDYPPCELNNIQQDHFYGWPYINGFGDLDPDYGTSKESLLENATSPAFGFPAHNAPLGMRFIRDAKVPAGYEKTALVALHGSWNRSTPDGYKVVALDWQDDGSITSRDFLTGFDKSGDVIGRPVDVAEGPDGCIFISDDYAGSIYRVCYGIEQETSSESAVVETTDPLGDVSPEELASANKQGESLYTQYACSGCHHLNGDGNLSGKSLNGLSQRYNLDSLSEYFVMPNPPMPRFNLDEPSRRALAIYLFENQ